MRITGLSDLISGAAAPRYRKEGRQELAIIPENIPTIQHETTCG